MANNIIINQSLIKKFFYKGVKRDYCPYHIYTHNIAGTHNYDSDSLNAGGYFETLCLGSGINGKRTDDLRRKKLTARQIKDGQTIGDKTIDQKRIEQQAMIFERYVSKYQISVHKDINTQVKLFKWFSKEDGIMLKGELDIFPTTILLPERGLRLATIDLKLTARFTDYGEYCWATPSSLDNIQGLFYNELTRNIDIELIKEMAPESRMEFLYTDTIRKQLEDNEPLFFYWVFNYKDNDLQNKFIEVGYSATDKAELRLAIRNTVDEINKNERYGWDNRVPSYDNCKMCGVLDCPVREVFKNKNNVEHTQFDTV